MIAVVDVGGGSTEVITGTIERGVEEVHSFKIGSGLLADTFLASDPPSASELRAVREHIAEFFESADLPQPEQAVAVGGSATSLRKVVGAELEYETLERAMRIFSTDSVPEVARRFRLDPTRVHPPDRRAASREGFRAARPAASDRQGRAPRGVILDLLNGSLTGGTGGASGAELA